MKTPLWQPTPTQIQQSNLTRFTQYVNEKYNQQHNNYPELYDWSIKKAPDFWAAIWDFTEIQTSQPYTTVVDDITRMPGARWFEGARLNFAQNLLRYRDDNTALIFKGESRPPVSVTYNELYAEVSRLARALRDCGVVPGDRVAGFLPNTPHAIYAMLAVTSIGAVWSSCSPDFGTKGVIDRFGQIEPKILFTADGYLFKGKPIDSLGRVQEIIKDLHRLEKIIVVPYLSDEPDLSGLSQAVQYDQFCAGQADEIQFEQLPFDHPVYVMYSSGTTGLPKCMVQGAGVLVNHLKELILHANLKRTDRIFYFTTCGWMMWNWLVSSLGVGATLVLYDGNPLHPDSGALWSFAAESRTTIFGTSPRYLAAVEDSGLEPAKKYDLSAIHSILSTGAPLSPENFKFVYRAIKPDVQLSSISGGTDLNGCFALGNPLLPVYQGELQCRGLGMAVDIFDEAGEPLRETKGELVCTQAFPSMPLHFWNDPDGKKYHKSYFDVYPNIWRHGDFAEITAQGGLIIYGRSDATLNPGGVRIGTADIYRLLENMTEIADSVVIGQDWDNDVRIVLFVKMQPGYECTDKLKEQIKKQIRSEISPRHTPAKILPVNDIPYTLNMKKVELSVKRVVQNEPVTNIDALINPESLENFKNRPELQE